MLYVRSHELEIQYGLTSFWALRLTPNVEQPAGASLEFTTIGLETQFVLVPRHGGTFGLALMGGCRGSWTSKSPTSSSSAR